MADMIHPFGKKIHDLAEVIPVNCTGCGICAMWCVMHCSCKVNCPSDAIRLYRPQQED